MNAQEQEMGIALLRRAYKAWMAMDAFRNRRLRNKNFTYGNQWQDLMTDEYGNRMREADFLRENGKEPLSNNLIRHLVKSVVGRFRNSLAGKPVGEGIRGVLAENCADELDSRLMEEFLISGCCCQKVECMPSNGKPAVRLSNVNPARLFLSTVDDVRGWDCTLVGELHDMPLAEMLRRFSDGNREKAVRICKMYGDGFDASCRLAMRQVASSHVPSAEFWQSGVAGSLRVVELWTKESRECYECHDRKTGEWYYVSSSARKQIPDDGNVDCRWTIRDVWRCHWIAPSGAIVSRYDSPFRHGSHPYAFKLYPLTDGEVHSLVEDVIDQQKYVNRLITLVDHVMGASAKGVLLYPDNILPDGYSWEDLRYAWSKPDAVIPYHPRGASDRPQQIAANATNFGAYEMLNLQMRLFEQISGVSGALQGQNVGLASGVKLYESQIENSTIALGDIFESFESFRKERNRLIEGI